MNWRQLGCGYGCFVSDDDDDDEEEEEEDDGGGNGDNQVEPTPARLQIKSVGVSCMNDVMIAVMVIWISLMELGPTFKELVCQLGRSFL